MGSTEARQAQRLSRHREEAPSVSPRACLLPVQADTACAKLQRDIQSIKQQKVGTHKCMPMQAWVFDVAMCCFLGCPFPVPHFSVMVSRTVHGPVHLQVTLQRQIEKSSREFTEWKRHRDRELLQLKKQGRLNAAQLQKVEALHSKQQAVLRRKMGGCSWAREGMYDWCCPLAPACTAGCRPCCNPVCAGASAAPGVEMTACKPMN